MNIEERIIKVVQEHTLEEAKLSDRLIEDLGADELDLVEICMGVEEAFDIMIEDEKFEKVKTVRDLMKFVASKEENPEYWL